jgi:RHS repeat-associated protein
MRTWRYRAAVLASITLTAGSLLQSTFGVRTVFPSGAAYGGGIVNAEAAAAPKLPVGELPERRTRTSKTERGSDGKLTTTLLANSVNYQDAKGKWQPIDSRLIGSSEKGYSWVNSANRFRSFFKKQTDAGYLRIDVKGQSYSLSLNSSSRGQGRIDGASAIYTGALPNVDLRYDVEADAVKETVLLNSANAPTSYQFLLKTPANASIVPSESSPGAWEVTAPGQVRPVLVLDAPAVQDSASQGAVTAPDRKPVSLGVNKLAGGEFQLDLTIDAVWLHSSSRIFPVLLDPTFVIQPDAVDRTFYACSGCGGFGGNYLYIGTDNNNAYRAGLKFDLSSIPMGAVVNGAQLIVTTDNVISISNPASSHQIDAHRITSAWDTSSSTPAFDATVLSSYVFPGTAPMAWDISSTVLNWLSGTQPNYGILLMRNPEPLGAGGPVPWSGSYAGDPTRTPRLSITYTTDAPALLQPTTLHSNGADLQWTPYAPSSGAPFQKWEVHRSLTPNFTPSASTLLTSTTDVSVTTYRDTTAAPGGTFYYKVLANASASQEVKVTLPPDGQATKVLQPAGDVGKDTFLYYDTGVTNCLNYGSDPALWLGTAPTRIYRDVLGFDLHDVPSGASITSATLTLFHQGTITNATNISAYRVTRDWDEGSGGCNNGANWYQAANGVAWTNQGGDVDPNRVAGVSIPAGEAPRSNDYTVTSAVQRWVNGQAPNLGLLLRYDDETLRDSAMTYVSSDDTTMPANWPRLSVNYIDGSHAIAPSAVISSPAAGATVRGTTTVNVAASDDRRVDRVELYVDGGSSPVGVATAPPFSFSWSTTGLANGAHSLSAKAYDDAGNSSPVPLPSVSVSVANYALPTSSITAPAPNATGLTGTVTVSTSNGVDPALSVGRVEVYVDGALYGVPATALPYSFSWNTLDPVVPAYDGTHTLTTRVYDSSGQAGSSAAITVTTANTAGTKYIAALTTATGAVPQTMSYDPTISPQLNYPVNVTVTNSSNSSWSSSTTFLRYRWYSPSSATPVFESGNIAALGLNKGKSSTVTVQVTPPALADGVNQAQFRLRFDVIDTGVTPAVAFADKGNPPLDNPVIVNKVLKTKLGLEHFYQYVQQPVGASMTQWTNVANGNSLLTLTPMQEPGRGLSTIVDLTYNSLEDHSESPAGNNWSLSISSLTRFGRPLDIHPNNADTIAGRSNKFIEFVDADGTLQHFDGVTGGDGVTFWEEPPGVHLYLRSVTTDTTNPKYWAITRPDRTTFYFNSDGYPTFVTDKNGNTISYTLMAVQPGDDPGGPKFHVTNVTDASGQGANPAPHRSFNVSYFTKATARKPQIRGKVSSIADHLGNEVDFSYYDDGNLLSISEKATSGVDGSSQTRGWIFTYTTSDGSGPAIPNAADRVNPDPKTANESTRIYSVRDPLGHETLFTYNGPTSGQDRWKLASVQDRAGASTSFSYDDVNLATTVAAPTPSSQTARTASYAYDIQGRPTSIRDPLGQQTSLQWSADNAVTRLTEPNTKFQQFTYNDNGELTDQIDQLGDHTVLTYQNVAADANDVSAHWNPSGGANGTGRTIPHLSQLATKQDPKEVALATANKWSFTYDANGNLKQVTEPLFGNPAVNNYNADGTLANSTDFDGNLTTYVSYDANGLPTEVVNATDNPASPTHPTQLGYDDGGRLRFVQDPNHAQFSGGTASQYQTQFFYDSFNRMGLQTTPKSTTLDLGTLILSSATYDANDNLLASTAPHCLPVGDCRNRTDTNDAGTGDVTSFTYDVMDRRTLVTGPDTSADPAGERTRYQYDVAGRVTQVTLPLGVQNGIPNNTHTVNYAYDALDRVIAQTQNHDTGSGIQALTTLSCYDTVGNLVSVTAPRAGLGSITCPGTTATPFTTVYGYDDAHRLTSVTAPQTNDGQHHQTRFAYDQNGNRTQVTDANNNTNVATYDALNRVVQSCQPFINGSSQVCAPGNGHPAVTVLQYDANGNLTTQVSPRGYDAAPAPKSSFSDFVTSYHYDALNRLVRTDLPVQGTSPHYYVHQAYDSNGNVVSSSLPVTTSDPTQVADSSKTLLTYFDPGWIASSQDPGGPRVHFDYTGKGEQRLRTPESGSGGPQIQWSYFPDGMLKEREDQNGQPVSYTYDAENHLTASHDASGLTGPQQTSIDTQTAYDDMGRLDRSDLKKQTDTNWTFSTYGYDANSNLAGEDLNGLETSPSGGTVVADGDVVTFDYDQANWLIDEYDTGNTIVGTSHTPQQRILEQFTPNGMEARREVDKVVGGAFAMQQVTAWSYYANDKLQSLTTTGTGQSQPLEQHTVGYLDPGGIYVNGNRTTDSFTLKPGTAASGACYPTACNASYTYDPRDRLTSQNDGRGTLTNYDLDPSGNIQDEKVNGNLTKQYAYQGSQLQQVTAAGMTSNYWYDVVGRLHCVTTAAGTAADCSTAASGASSNLLADYEYDYMDRLQSYQAYSGGGRTDYATYTYDALNRLASETELHPNFNGNTRSTQFSYSGLGGQLTEEQQSNSTGVLDTRDYSYDVYGNRLSQTITGSTLPTVPNGTSTYGYDVHGSVSQLIDANGNSQASYGYKAYGQTDGGLTQGDPDPLNPVSSFRYSAKRTDTGSNTLDMGVRRFGPDVSRFLTPDVFFGALSNLSLSLDPITQNRYGLAGGNPISFKEWDGHVALTDGGGGASTTPSPDRSTASAGGRVPADGAGLIQGALGSLAQAPIALEQYGLPLAKTTINCFLPFSSGCHDVTGAVGQAVTHPRETALAAEKFAFGTNTVDLGVHGGGVGYSGAVEINAGPVKAAVSVSGDVGVTHGRGGWSAFFATSAGAFVQVPDPTNPSGRPLVKESFPGRPNDTPAHDPQNVSGAFVGAGPHAFITNAQSPYDLKGPFTQYGANAGAIESGGIQANVGTNSMGQGIYTVALAPRFAPFGAGVGASGSAYDTATCVEAAYSQYYGMSGAAC